jgi:hypothetical protein
MPGDTPLPSVPNTPMTARSIALGALHIATDIPRSLMVISGIPAFRQGGPLMADAIARGAPHEIPLAFARSLASLVRTDAGMSQVTSNFRRVLTDAGMPERNAYRLISDTQGPLAAREEFTLHSILDRVPVIKQLNRLHPTFLNSLRTGAATALIDMNKVSGKKSSWDDIEHTIRIWSGRGDLPGGPEVQSVLSGAFFGPKLNTAAWQSVTDTLGSLFRTAQSIPGAMPGFLRGEGQISKAAITPVELANIRTAAAFVASGVGLMKMAKDSGFDVGVNPLKTDFGRITLPDGTRIDLWGPLNENARLIARMIDFVHGVAEEKPVGYGANDLYDLLINYGRSKLNAGYPQLLGDVAAGKTQAGVPTRQAYSSTDFNVNPAIPIPMDLASAINAMDLPYPGKTKPTGGRGGVLGVGETLLASLGGTVINQPAKVVYDGVGRPESDPQFAQDPVLVEHIRLQKLDPQWKKGEALTAPDATIGSGRNSIALDPASAQKYIQAVGEERRKQVSALIYSPDYQNATVAQQEKMYDAAMSKANNDGDRYFLARGVIDSTDPATIRAEAVQGFIAQGTNKDRAYWIALLDRAGKLTPEVKAAIDDSSTPLLGQKAPITVDEYLRNAPLIHEYLSRVPYGLDRSPIGTPADWTAVAAAHDAQNVRRDELTRAGVAPSLADTRAQSEILKSLTSLVQRNLFLNGAQLENPQRRLLAAKYPGLSRFIDQAKKNVTKESDADYENFPFGAAVATSTTSGTSRRN